VLGASHKTLPVSTTQLPCGLVTNSAPLRGSCNTPTSSWPLPVMRVESVKSLHSPPNITSRISVLKLPIDAIADASFCPLRWTDRNMRPTSEQRDNSARQLHQG